MGDVPKPTLDFIVAVATVLGTIAAWLALYPLGKSLWRYLRSSRPGRAEQAYLKSFVLDLESRNRKNHWSDRFYVDLAAELRETRPQYEARIAYYVVRSIHRRLRQQDFDSLTNAEKIDSSRGVTYNSLEAALGSSQDNARVVIGAPGGGKTVSLRNFAQKEAQKRLAGKSSTLPIFVDLAHYTREGTDGIPEPFESFLETYFLQGGYQTFLANRHWEQLLKTSKAIVFLDGLDELPRKPTEFGERARFIETFIRSWPTCQFVLSCRERDYDRRLSFQQILIKPFDERQIYKYLKHYFGRSLAREIERSISLTPMMTDLCRNPFYLDLVCYFLRLRKSLPRTKSELFGCITDEFARREAGKKRRETADLDLGLFRTVLGPLAYHMGVRQMSTSIQLNAYTAVAELSSPEKDVLHDAIEGALLEHNPESDNVRFQHHRFQEFFCADLLAKDLQTGQWPLPRSFFTNLWWRETVLFVAGLASADGVGILVDRIITERDIPQHPNEVIARALRLDLTILAFECVLGSSEFSNAVLYRSLRHDILQAYDTGNTLERAQVVEALRADESPEAVSALRTALKDDSPWVSERAFFALSGGGMRFGMKFREGFRELCRLFIEGRVLSTIPPFFRVARHSRLMRLLLPLLMLLAVANIACIALVAYTYFWYVRFLLFRLNYAWTVHCIRCFGAAFLSMSLTTHFLFATAGPLLRRLIRVTPLALLQLYVFSRPGKEPLLLISVATICFLTVFAAYNAFWKRPHDPDFSLEAMSLGLGAFAGTELIYQARGLFVGKPGASSGFELEMTRILGPFAIPMALLVLSGALAFTLGFFLRQVWIFHRLRDCQIKLETALNDVEVNESSVVSTMKDLLGRLGTEWAQRVLLHRFLMIVNRRPGFSREQKVAMLGQLADGIVDLSLKDAVYQALEQEWSNFRREIEPAAPAWSGLA